MSAESTISSRLAFLSIDQATIACLRENKDFILGALPGALDQFYAHIAKFPETSRFFRNKEHIAQAKQAQIRHWAIIANGGFDEAYAASVTRIGETHNRLGLDTRWYIGGYSKLVSLLIEAVALKMPSGLLGANVERKAMLQSAILKASLLDMDFAIAVYLDANRRDYNDMLNLVADDFERSFGGVFSGLNATAIALRKTSESLTSTASNTSSQASSVAAAAEEASGNVQTVAAAAEQLSASVRDIAGQVERSKQISEQALETADSTSAKIEQLLEATQKIGAVVSLINNIARQTNLLALNATIEAARAGEAGKGFAVVAQEVKVLADQTAAATGDITVQIEYVQSSTSDAVAAIRRIGEIIHSMTDISTAVSGAVEQQGAATNEISHNISEAAVGTREVSSNIFGVSRATEQTGKASEDVLHSAEAVSAQAVQVRDEVDRFLKLMHAKIAENAVQVA